MCVVSVDDLGPGCAASPTTTEANRAVERSEPTPPPSMAWRPPPLLGSTAPKVVEWPLEAGGEVFLLRVAPGCVQVPRQHLSLFAVDGARSLRGSMRHTCCLLMQEKAAAV